MQASAQLSGWVIFCLFLVYTAWGSTYLAQRFALSGFPPFLLGGLRFTLAGALMLAFLRLRGEPWPKRRELRGTALLGLLFFVGGTGFVSFAQQYVASGVAAIVVATVPLWAALFGAFFGTRPSRLELLGLALGVSGVALLQRGGAFEGSLLGFVLLVLAPISWALGTILSPRLTLPRGAMASALQMLWGGLYLFILAGLLGEQWQRPTVFAVGALLYLVTFGSLIGFLAFSYLLANTRPAVATSYAFVNPGVALILGGLLASEPLDASSLLACAVAIAGVVAVLLGRKR